MRKFLAPASIAMTMAMSGAALADFGSNTTASSMVRPNVYYEAQNAAYAEPRPDSIAPASDIRGYLYSEGSQIAYTPVSPDSVNPDQELDESVYGIEWSSEKLRCRERLGARPAAPLWVVDACLPVTWSAAERGFERTSDGAMSDTVSTMLLPEEGRMFAETAQPFLEGDFRRSIWVGVVD